MIRSGAGAMIEPITSWTVSEWSVFGTFLAVVAAVAGPFLMHWLELRRRSADAERAKNAAMITIAWELKQLDQFLENVLYMKDHSDESFVETMRYLIQLLPETREDVSSPISEARVALMERLNHGDAVTYANILGLQSKVLKTLRAYIDLSDSPEPEAKEKLFSSAMRISHQCRGEIEKLSQRIDWQAFG